MDVLLIVESRSGKRRPAGERDAETIYRDRGETRAGQRARSPRTRRRSRSSSGNCEEVAEVVGEDQGEQAEAQQQARITRQAHGRRDRGTPASRPTRPIPIHRVGRHRAPRRARHDRDRVATQRVGAGRRAGGVAEREEDGARGVSGGSPRPAGRTASRFHGKAGREASPRWRGVAKTSASRATAEKPRRPRARRGRPAGRETARQEARPGHQRIRPAAPDDGSTARYIIQHTRPGARQARLRSKHQGDLGFVGHVARDERPGEHRANAAKTARRIARDGRCGPSSRFRRAISDAAATTMPRNGRWGGCRGPLSSSGPGGLVRGGRSRVRPARTRRDARLADAASTRTGGPARPGFASAQAVRASA